MATRIGPDYEALGAQAASYMVAPVILGPELKGKVTALGSGTRNPTAGGIPIHTPPGVSGVDYVSDESSLRSKPSKPLPLSISEGRLYADFTPEADDTARILDAIRRDEDAMKTSDFNREIRVVPVSDMSKPDVGTKIHASDFSRADLFRPLPANLTGQKAPSGPGIRFVHFSDVPMDKMYAKV